MHRLVILLSVAVLAAGAASCADSNSDRASTIVAPTAVGGTEAKGGGKPADSSSSLTPVMVIDNNADGRPNWGDSVTFNISTTKTSEPNVSLTCTQNGVTVYGATAGFYTGYPWPWTQVMKLSSNSWQGGAADCVAKLYYFSGTKTVYLASTSFTAFE